MNIKLFKDLCEATGAPGFEYAIRELIISEMTPLADEISVDNIGNVTALIKGKSSEKTIMCAAHMDEIGFIVRHIDDNGFIRILPLGGFDPKTLTAQRVTVHGKKDLPPDGHTSGKPALSGGCRKAEEKPDKKRAYQQHRLGACGAGRRAYNPCCV